MNTDYLFVATKPLQIMVSLCIIDNLGIIDKATLAVVDSFHDSGRVLANFQREDWKYASITSCYAKDYRDAYRIGRCLKPAYFLSFADVGTRLFLESLRLQLASPKTIIAIGEEGIGTYRRDLYGQKMKCLLDALGIGTYFGGCRFTKRAYVFDKNRYQQTFPAANTLIEEITYQLRDLIRNHFASIARIFSYEATPARSEIACLYLSSWEIDSAFLDHFRYFDGDLFVKLHPHLKVIPDNLPGQMIRNSVPAEIPLTDMAQRYRQLRVFHHGTSTAHYIDFPNVSFESI